MLKRTLLSIGLMLAAVPAASAATIFADNFNSNPSDQLGGNLAVNPNGWTIQNGSVDVIGGPGTSFNWYPGNGSYLDMDGSAGASGQNTTITTNSLFNLAAGTYTFSFDYGINHNDGGDSDSISIGIFDGTSYLTLLTVDANALNHLSSTFTSASITVALAAMSGVQFFITGQSVGSVDQSGGIVDNFAVSAVPLPGAALLLLTGLVGAGGMASLGRRRKKVAV